MTPLRQSRWVSAFVAAVVAIAWFGASNHCALASIETARKPAHACCHEEGALPQPAKATQCCEAFSVPLPEQAMAPALSLNELGPAWLEAGELPAHALGAEFRSVRANAPPEARSFAETVLNRSLLAHAPPSFVA